MQIKPLDNFIIFDESVDIKQYLKIELACNRPFQNILFKIRKFHRHLAKFHENLQNNCCGNAIW